MTQFMSVIRRRPPFGQIVFGTLNHATCDVYSPKAVENVTDIGSFNVCKIFFFGFVEALDLKRILNNLRINGMC